MLHGDLAYSSFVPTPLPPKPPLEMSEEMLKLLGTAHHLLGKLDGISVTLIDVDFFIAMYVRKEALLSSQIEGTQASLASICKAPNTLFETGFQTQFHTASGAGFY